MAFHFFMSFPGSFTSNDQIVLLAFVDSILRYLIFRCLAKSNLEDTCYIAACLYLHKRDKILSTAGGSIVPMSHVLG